MERGAHTTASLFCYNLARCVKIRSSNSYREEEEIQVDGLKLDLMKMAGIQSLPAVAAVSERKDTPRGTGLSFEDLLESSMKQVNDIQQDSDKMVNRLATGDVDDISEVVLSAQRAEFALRLITEVRNKLVDAYQQLGRMSV